MAGEGGGSKGRRWVVRTPETAPVRIDVSIDEGVAVSPEVKSALENLISAIARDDEVTGYLRTSDPCCPLDPLWG